MRVQAPTKVVPPHMYRLPMSGVSAEHVDPFDDGLDEVRESLHDKRLVSTVCKKRVKGNKGLAFNLVSGFAGKDFCFSDYMRGIRRLPLSEAHAVWYDNSNDPKVRAKLLAALKENFRSYELIEDKNRSYTCESTEDYAKISWRCHCFYNEVMERRIIKSLPLTMSVEDDVEVPKNAWRNLTTILAHYPQVGTAVSACLSRRLKDYPQAHPLAFDFDRYERVGGDGAVMVTSARIMVPKQLGVDMIGAAHMGCWLTRTKLISQIGFNYNVDGVRGQDLCWGYELNRAGYRMAMDWSLQAKHYHLNDGVKEFLV